MNHSRSPQPRTFEHRAGAADLAALGGEDAELAGQRRQHQDRGVDRGERDVEQLGVLRPQLGAHRADREVRREQRREEHQLAGEPDDRPDADHARTVVVPVEAGGRDGRCCRHAVIMSSPALRGQTRGGVFGHLVCRFTRCRPSTLSRVVTGWELAPVPLVVTVWAAGLYLVGVRSLHRRGDAWPVGRTVMFVGVGMGSFYVATSSGLAAYDTTLLSVHMVQHMVLSMLVPLALALGAPVTLALRTLPRRAAALAARRAALAGGEGAVVPAADPARSTSSRRGRSTSPAGTTPRWTHVWLHELMHVHLVVVGALFFWPIVGIDPRARAGSATRSGCCWSCSRCRSTPSSASRSWARRRCSAATTTSRCASRPATAGCPTPSTTSTWPAGILWASGDLVGLVLFGVLFVQWVRSSMKEAEREDRRLDLLEARARDSGRRPWPTASSVADRSSCGCSSTPTT